MLVSGTAPIWPDGSVDPDPYVQATRCFEIIAAALAELDASVDQVVRTRMFITDAAHAESVGKAHGEVMGKARPTATMVVVKGLLDEKVEGRDRGRGGYFLAFGPLPDSMYFFNDSMFLRIPAAYWGPSNPPAKRSSPLSS